MPFIGKSPSEGKNNILLDAITTSATATYNLTKDSVAYSPVSAQSLMVSLNGVTQAPIAAYTVSGSTIVFASALTSNDVIDYIIATTGPVKTIDVTDISAGQLTSSMLQDDAITSAKIADDAVVQAAVADESIDEARLQISNAGSNGQFLSKQSGNTGGLTWASAGVSGISSSADATAINIDSSERVTMTSQPYFCMRATETGSIGNNGSWFNIGGLGSGLWTNNSGDNYGFNVGSHFNTTTGVFTAPVAGVYSFTTSIRIQSWSGSYYITQFWINDTYGGAQVIFDSDTISSYYTSTLTEAIKVDANDTVQVRVYNSGDNSYTIDNNSYFCGYLVH